MILVYIGIITSDSVVLKDHWVFSPGEEMVYGILRVKSTGDLGTGV